MPRSLLSSYPHTADRFDEMLAADGELRTGWQDFFWQMGTAAPHIRDQHLDYVRRSITENGVTYNVYADPKGADRPWELDPLPLILAADEWSEIAAAVTQRARMLNALLADLYGPQTLLKDGSLPSALVFGHNGFLWPCHGIRPPDDVWLQLYAADLARSPDGRWWVIGDRTQAVSGTGYALENRLIVSRLFSDEIRDLRVHQLGSFFAALQGSLVHRAPLEAGETKPHIVLLTPGPYNETYFEHAYLARHLGYPLVEGQDLTVRDDRVYLRTLNGLSRVHVILRRLDDDYCDPLELRGDSALGIPGLLQAVRAGHVLVANALGSGVLQSAALPGFLPGVCQKLLGEPLRMPTVGTWWCGETAALDFVIEHLDQLVIKGAFPSQRMEPVFGSDLDAKQRAAMIGRLRAHSSAYVAQEIVRFSLAPSWSQTPEPRLVPRGVALRVFVTATPDGYQAMPGGLTRVTSSTNARFISMQRGGSSKDTWVLSDKEASSFSLLRPPVHKADVIRSGSNLTSRVVENLFWFGRYSERCEGEARLLHVVLSRLVDTGDTDVQGALESALDVGRALKLIPDREVVEKLPAAQRRRLRSNEAQALLALNAPDGGECLAANIRRLLWVGLQVRERLSLGNWRVLNQLQLDLQAYAGGRPTISEALAFIDRMLLASTTLAGFAMDDMTRDDGWRFLIVGRHLERIVFLSEAISHFLRRESSQAAGSLDWLLELADSIITYRSRYMAKPELLPAIDLIVFDPANPHSVAFQLRRLERHLAGFADERIDSDEHPLLAAAATLESFDLAALEGEAPGAADEGSGVSDLANRLAQVAWHAQNLSDRLAMRYFTHIGQIGRQTLTA